MDYVIASPLRMQSLIQETLRRRKAEKITQKQHALLAGVSVPTIKRFEDGDTSLTMQKIIDILSVVGLVAPTNNENNLENFIRAARTHWHDLKYKNLEETTRPMRKGGVSFSFQLNETMNKKLNLKNLQRQVLDYSFDPGNFLNSNLTPFEEDIFSSSFYFYNFWVCGRMGYDTPCELKYLRANQNGLFYYFSSFSEDKIPSYLLGDVGKVYPYLICKDITIFNFLDIVFFASNLALENYPEDDTDITMQVNYEGLTNRVLFESFYVANDKHSIVDTFQLGGKLNPRKIFEDINYLKAKVIDLYKDFFIEFDWFRLTEDKVDRMIERYVQRTGLYKPDSSLLKRCKYFYKQY